MKLFYFQFFFLFLFPVRFIDLRRIKVSLIIHPYRQRWDAQWFLWFSLYYMSIYPSTQTRPKKKQTRKAIVRFFLSFHRPLFLLNHSEPPLFFFFRHFFVISSTEHYNPPIYFVWKEEELFLCWSSSLRVGEENQLVPPPCYVPSSSSWSTTIFVGHVAKAPKKKSPPLSFLSLYFSKSSLFFF